MNKQLENKKFSGLMVFIGILGMLVTIGLVILFG